MASTMFQALNLWRLTVGRILMRPTMTVTKRRRRTEDGEIERLLPPCRLDLRVRIVPDWTEAAQVSPIGRLKPFNAKGWRHASDCPQARYGQRGRCTCLSA